MPKVRVSYDGWIALPAAMRQKLKLSTGDQLDLELSSETITSVAFGSRVDIPGFRTHDCVSGRSVATSGRDRTDGTADLQSARKST